MVSLKPTRQTFEAHPGSFSQDRFQVVVDQVPLMWPYRKNTLLKPYHFPDSSLVMLSQVEQATHFVDLSRYFGGDAVLESVQAHSLESFEEAGQLEKIPIDEESIPANDRVPRVTSATWK